MHASIVYFIFFFVGWQDVVGLDGVKSHLTYCKLALDSPCGNPRVSFTLRINDTFTWVLLVGGCQILPSDSALLSDLPSSLVTGMYSHALCVEHW